jgi:hypothetical protein
MSSQNEAQSSEQSDNQISEVTNDQTIKKRSPNEAQSSEQSDNQISEVTNDQTIEMRSQNVHQKADESDIHTHKKVPGIDSISIAKQNQNIDSNSIGKQNQNIDSISIAKQNQNIDSNSIAKQNKRQNVNIKSATQKRQKVDTNSATQKRQKVDTNSANPFSKRDTNSHQIQHRYATRGNIAHQVNHAFLTYQNSSTTHYNTVDIVHQAHIAGLTVSLYKQNLKSKKNSHNIEEVPCALFNSTSGCRHKRSHTAGNKFLVHRKPKSKIEKDKLLYFMQTNQLIPCRIP